MFILSVVRDWLLFSALVLGGGAAFAPIGRTRSHEAWCIGIAAGLGVNGAAMFLPFAANLSTTWMLLGPALTLVTLFVRRKHAAALFDDSEVRDAAFNWALLSVGTLALLGCITSYSGGAWVGDWKEHYDRALLFLHAFPEEQVFGAHYPVPTRPPLANLDDAVFLWLTDASFARHQVFMLLLNSLVAFPAMLAARSFNKKRQSATWAALLMLLEPLFLQNTTYPWTKLITAFFVLTSLHVLFTGANERWRAPTGFAVMGLGVLAHYSACVWLITAALVRVLLHRNEWHCRIYWSTLLRSVALFLAVITPWLGYAVIRYGPNATFGSNSTADAMSKSVWWENLFALIPKLWNTLVPHSLRVFDRFFIHQANPWGQMRDDYFYLYQSNLFFALGCPALVILAFAALRTRDIWSIENFRIVAVGVGFVILLGTGVHGTVDNWGLVHICLQPLVLLGIAVAAATAPRLFSANVPSGWRVALVASGVFDILFGSALHFLGAAFALNRGAYPHLIEYLSSVSIATRSNLWLKLRIGAEFFADKVAANPLLPLVTWLAIAGFLALRICSLSSQAQAVPAATNRGKTATTPTR